MGVRYSRADFRLERRDGMMLKVVVVAVGLLELLAIYLCFMVFVSMISSIFFRSLDFLSSEMNERDGVCQNFVPT